MVLNTNGTGSIDSSIHEAIHKPTQKAKAASWRWMEVQQGLVRQGGERLRPFQRPGAVRDGDRGVQCSSGQRARIGLARALYRDADLVLLDDPLSAVDSKVGRLIYYSAIVDLCIKRGKCVVLVTHQHQYIGDDPCILMDDGRVVFQGSYSECVGKSSGKLTTSLQAQRCKNQRSILDEREEDRELYESEDTPLIETDMANDSDPVGVHKEARTTGLVKLSTWRDYASAMGGVWVGICVLLLFAFTQVSALVSIVFIGKWSERPPPEPVHQIFFSFDSFYAITIFA